MVTICIIIFIDFKRILNYSVRYLKMPSNSNFKLEPTTDVVHGTELNTIDNTKQSVHHDRFINFDEIGQDLKKIADIFNSYATKKTIATGFFNLALIGNFNILKISYLNNFNSL